jgi:nucleoredoxin
VNTYLELKEKGQNFEVIFVCMDGTEDEWKQYHASMPWLAIPYSDFEVADDLYDYTEKYGSLLGCPWLLLLNPDGKPIGGNGRMMLMRHSAAFPWALETIEAQKEKEKKWIEYCPKEIQIDSSQENLELILNETVGWCCNHCGVSGMGWAYHDKTQKEWKESYHPRCALLLKHSNQS